MFGFSMGQMLQTRQMIWIKANKQCGMIGQFFHMKSLTQIRMHVLL